MGYNSYHQRHQFARKVQICISTKIGSIRGEVLLSYEENVYSTLFTATRLFANSQSHQKRSDTKLVPAEVSPNSHIRLCHEVSYYYCQKVSINYGVTHNA